MQRKMKLCTFSCGAGFFTAALIAAFILFTGCEQPAGVVRDDDAELISLELDHGVLNPAFSASHFNYRVTVRNIVDTITVTAVANSGKTRISGAGATPVVVGSNNTIQIKVTAENGDNNTYTITATRAGPGTKEITTPADMARIGADDDWTFASDYLLISNITLSNWSGVANGNGEVFSGTFDGGGNTITLNGLALSNNGDTAGIFCRITGDPALPAVIQNVVVAANVSIDEDRDSVYAGAVAGRTAYTSFEDIIVRGQIFARNAYSSPGNKILYLGGIAGTAENSAIRGCRNEAKIYGFGRAASGSYNRVGGIVGQFSLGTEITDCHNTGNISGETTGGGSNMFAGGIAGGSFYYFTTEYSGKIEGCSSTGNIHASGGGYWSWAGGIAGTIVGYGNGSDKRTRIVRCNASGRISVAGPKGSWPYVGGICGYNYYGSLIEQCYFEGDVVVESEGVSDYAGGISGYNSRYEGGMNSTVQDCWSSGTVTGYVNAGGIVGQNQVESILRRCYSTMAVVVTAPPNTTASEANLGAGGIAGFSVSAEKDGVAACVALNPSVSAPNGFTSGKVARLGRVVGTTSPIYVADGFTAGRGLRDNYAWGVTVTSEGNPIDIEPYIDGVNGRDVPANYFSGDKPSQAFYTTLLGWDFASVWKMGADGYPKLKWQK